MFCGKLIKKNYVSEGEKMEDKKRSTYYAESQKKYNAKNKIISCKVNLEYYNNVKTHSENKGYKSINSYIIGLIKKDMEK